MGNKPKKSLWSFGTREVVFAAIGAALYGVLSFATNFLQLPGTGNVAFRPAIVIPLFFGVAYGPIVGLITGFLGNILGDLLSGYGFWIWWDLGNGIIGLIAGLCAAMMVDYKSIKDLIIAEVFVVLACAGGMFVASISEMWVSGLSFGVAMATTFVPSFITNVVNGLILTPLLMIAYSAIRNRSGR
ncbi:MAG: ECF transporter S component [Anaerolineaceae bacterium]|nr:ECF transporter S component [Anaerolineaceae bacterium]